MVTRQKYKYFDRKFLLKFLKKELNKYYDYKLTKKEIAINQKIFNLYFDYAKEALLRGYALDIPRIGIFKMFGVKNYGKRRTGNLRTSIKDASIEFVLVGATSFAERRKDIYVGMGNKFRTEFYDRYGDTEMFYKIMGTNEQNKLRKGYY